MPISPFGLDHAQPTYDIGVQNHFGAALTNFNVSADWSSQGGRLTMTLVEDTGKFSVPVISSPYEFNISGSGSGGAINFTYGGIVQSVERNSSNSKLYTVSLESPLKILDCVSVIMDQFVGAGSGTEGASNLVYSALTFGSIPVSDWPFIYNTVNIFGSFENNDAYYGNIYGSGNYKHGFGSATVNDRGIPLNKVIYALDTIINRAYGDFTYMGGNILYGTNSYNIAAGTGVPYYYFFDAIDFYNQVYPYLGNDFRVGQGVLSMSLLDIVSQVCEAANLEFIVDLDYQQDTLATAGTQSYTGYPFGGTISIRTISKNAFLNQYKPFSNIAYNLLPLEKPDLVGFDGMSGIHPGHYSGTATDYQDPLDDDYTGVGTLAPNMNSAASGSAKYGGMFPVQPTSDFTLSGIHPESVNLSIVSTDGTTSKMVVGGYQSRFIQVTRPNIMQYWGDITVINGAGQITGSSTSDLQSTATVKIPVITNLLHPVDVEDFIMIDMQSIFGTRSIERAIAKGIYAASLFEIRLAMKGFDQWLDFIEEFKALKYYALEDVYNPRPAGSRSTKTFNEDGSLGLGGKSRENGVGNGFTKKDTRTDKGEVANEFGVFTDAAGVGSYVFEEKILPQMHSIIKSIGDTHYGKSWYVPMPIPSVKLADSDLGIVGDFVTSWDIADAAYLEPANFYAHKAPQSRNFIENGLLSAYVNYNHSFFYNTGDSGIFEDSYSAEFVSPLSNNINIYNFSEYDVNDVAYTRYPNGSVFHAKPDSVSNYTYIPYNYFSLYNRGLIPFTDVARTGTYLYSLNALTGVHPLGVIPINPTALGAPTPDPTGNKLRTRQTISAAISGTLANNYYANGTNSFAFIHVTTPRTFMPIYQNDDTALGDINGGQMFAAFAGKPVVKNSIDFSLNAKFDRYDLFKVCVAPESITIPQRSNRYVYGPWITNIGASRIYAGKVIYEQDSSLVPENFVIPDFGNFGGSYNYYSGTSGMNIAGQAIANALDDFSLFAEEQGSITLPGFPLISRIGDSLYGVQNITDINVSVDNTSVKTTYNFRTYSPRIGRTNREVVQKMQKISSAFRKKFNV